MGVEQFNDTSMANGPVPRQGTRNGATPPAAPKSAKGIPKGVSQTDGTANLRAESVTKMAERHEVSVGKSSIPKGVSHFSDAEV